jgi:hypothetical protein
MNLLSNCRRCRGGQDPLQRGDVISMSHLTTLARVFVKTYRNSNYMMGLGMKDLCIRQYSLWNQSADRNTETSLG